MATQTERRRAMFMSDSRIMMDTLRRILRAAESGRLTEDQVDRAFRAAHSLKSVAGFQNLDSITATAHSLEDVLLTVRDSSGALPSATFEKLKKGVGVLESRLQEYYSEQIGTVDQSDSSVRSSDVPADRSEDALPRATKEDEAGNHVAESAGPSIADQLKSESVQSVLREARDRGERVYRIVLRIDTVAELTYPRAFLVLNNLELGSAVLAASPNLDDLSGSDGVLSLVVSTSDDEPTLRRRVHVDEVVVQEVAQLQIGDLISVSEAWTQAASENEPSDTMASSIAGELRLLGDVLQQAAVRLNGDSQPSQEGIEGVRQQVLRVAHYLSHRAPIPTRVRLVERIAPVKEKMEHYARQQQKLVHISVEGSGALVSPGIADAVHDVVLHLVRNSIEHGIQFGPDRIRAGKRPGGNVSISVDRSHAGSVSVSVSDDGRGVDESRVRERQAADDPLAMDKSLFELLATPGYTTRAEPSIGAGRGVGLDAVRHSVERLLQGDAVVESSPENGLCVTVTFSADVDLLSVELASQGRTLYAIPSVLVVRTEQLDLQRLKRDSFGSVYYDSGGSRVPVVLPSGRVPRLDRLQADAPVLICRGPDGLAVVAADAHYGSEAVVRDEQNKRVYSRKRDSDARLVLPGIS